MDDIQRTKLMGLRIKLTPDEYAFARFYGREVCSGSPQDYLRALLIKALSREMRRARKIKARMRAEEAETDGLQSPEGYWPMDLEDQSLG